MAGTTKIILEAIKKSSTSKSIGILDIFLTDYHTSYKLARQKLLNPGTESVFDKIEDIADRVKKEKVFYNTVARLQKQGLVKKKEVAGKNLWKLTEIGNKKLASLKNKPKKLPDDYYKKEAGDKLTLVIFDIPEEERIQRRWLRKKLVYLNFSLLQKSVWMGKNKLPIEFIEDLKKIGIFKYLHIFHVVDDGTLNNG
jgi:DNA-binding transcriptional regulator PaaX